MIDSGLPQLLTVAQVARALNVHPETVRRRIADDTIPAVRIGGIVRVPAPELQRVLRTTVEVQQ